MTGTEQRKAYVTDQLFVMGNLILTADPCFLHHSVNTSLKYDTNKHLWLILVSDTIEIRNSGKKQSNNLNLCLYLIFLARITHL